MDVALPATPPPAQSVAATTQGAGRARALAILAGSLGAGLATQALLFRAHMGLGWFVADVALVVAMLLLFGGRRTTIAGGVLAAACVTTGGAFVWYSSDWALFTALPANFVFLCVLPFVLARRLRLRDLGTLPRAMCDGLLRTPRSIVESALLPRDVLDRTGRSHARRVLIGAAISVPLTTIFLVLLSADPAFSHVLSRAVRRSGTIGQFGVYAGISAALYLVGYVLHARPARDAAAPAPETVAPWPYRQVGDALVYHVETPRSLVRPLTWTVVLVPPVLLFGAFVAVNLRQFFGGHALVRAAGTPTYAHYLHSGFFQVSLATLLAVLTVVAGHWLVRDPVTKRPAGGATLAAMESALLVLTAVTLASSWQRLHIYEEAYGYTYLRVGVAFCQLAVLGLLALTLVKAVARGWQGYGGAVLLGAVGVWTLAGAFDADGYVARKNVERLAAGPQPVGLDVGYLEGLSADAAGVLEHPVLHSKETPLSGENDPCEESAAGPPDVRLPADRLREAWRERAAAQREGGWRSFRGFRAMRWAASKPE